MACPRLHVVGVRHHSPACARLVAHKLRKVRPSFVLIEGPADMNERLGELMLGHQLPIAIYSFHRLAGGQAHATSKASWAPFCEYSPEWQALLLSREIGSRPLFIDLPAWHPSFHGINNRYGDHELRRARAMEALCHRFQLDGYDTLWEHLFEGPADTEAELESLDERLRAYFAAMRTEELAGPREAFMAAWIRAALAEAKGGHVVVVCGGFHAPALCSLEAADCPGWPEVPKAEDAHSYLVPYSYHRLDSFTGYESGMPSPGFYEGAFRSGARRAPEHALESIVQALREQGQRVCAADLISATSLAEGLARMRGHECLRRTDLLDGLASALVKESLDAPLPWSKRGLVCRETDALLLEILRALSGKREGKLHASTPRPALLSDVAHTLAAQGLETTAVPRTVHLKLHEPDALAKSRTLHRLRVLEIPGFERKLGPQWATDAVLEELWSVMHHEFAESALIEAASFGATLVDAASLRLEEALAAPKLDISTLTALLGEAIFVGVESLTGRALDEVRRHAASEANLSRLGEALQRLLGIFTQDVLFNVRGWPELEAAIAEAFTRGLWLLENLAGAGTSADAWPIAAVMALRDVARTLGPQTLPNAINEACAVFRRRACAADAPADVRGACFGALWSLGDAQVDADTATHAVRQAALPASFGDFLSGLFTLAREETVHQKKVLAAIDEVLVGMAGPEFLVALPALRLAFSYFPPREKATIAERLSEKHGHSSRGANLLMLEASAEAIARGCQMDAEVDEAMRQFGLLVSTFHPKEAP